MKRIRNALRKAFLFQNEELLQSTEKLFLPETVESPDKTIPGSSLRNLAKAVSTGKAGRIKPKAHSMNFNTFMRESKRGKEVPASV